MIPGDNWGTQHRRNVTKPGGRPRRHSGVEVVHLQGQSCWDREMSDEAIAGRLPTRPHGSSALPDGARPGAHSRSVAHARCQKHASAQRLLADACVSSGASVRRLNSARSLERAEAGARPWCVPWPSRCPGCAAQPSASQCVAVFQRRPAASAWRSRSVSRTPGQSLAVVGGRCRGAGGRRVPRCVAAQRPAIPAESVA